MPSSSMISSLSWREWGAALSPLSQIVTIADVYESMLGTREGRPPLLPAQVIKELYQQGRAQQLDLGLV